MLRFSQLLRNSTLMFLVIKHLCFFFFLFRCVVCERFSLTKVSHSGEYIGIRINHYPLLISVMAKLIMKTKALHVYAHL